VNLRSRTSSERERDTKKITTLLDEAHRLAYSNPQTAQKLAEQAIELSNILILRHHKKLKNSKQTTKSIHKIESEKMSAEMVLLHCRIMQEGITDEVITTSEKLVGKAREIDNSELLAKCLVQLASHHQQRNSSIGIIQPMLDEAVRLFYKVGRYDAALHAEYNLALALQHSGSTADAYSKFRMLLDKAKGQKLYPLIARLHISIGNVYDGYSEFGNAIEEYRLAIDIAREHKLRTTEANALNNISTALYQAEYPHQAIDALNICLDVQRSLGNKLGIAHALGNLGGCYRDLGDHAKAQTLMQSAVEIFQQLSAQKQLIRQLCALGRVEAHLGNYRKALSTATSAIAMAKEINDDESLCLAHISMMRVRMLQKNWAKAKTEWLHSMRFNAKLQTTVYTSELLDTGSVIAEQIGDLKMALQLQRDLLSTFKEIHSSTASKRMQLYGIQLQVERANYERTIATIKAEQLQHELDAKKKELQSVALRLVEKQELITELKKNIERIEKQWTESSTEITSALSSLATAIDRTAHTSDREWETFREQFEGMSDEFITRMATMFPLLTPAELKVCALLRLQLSSKDVARILHLTERTIEKHRLSIRKKIRAGKTNQLASLLASL
jgi:tetratricopeptide (TPR) repeat protein/DNA-binding CsgD family transcriptional regulator